MNCNINRISHIYYQVNKTGTIIFALLVFLYYLKINQMSCIKLNYASNKYDATTRSSLHYICSFLNSQIIQK